MIATDAPEMTLDEINALNCLLCLFLSQDARQIDEPCKKRSYHKGTTAGAFAYETIQYGDPVCYIISVIFCIASSFVATKKKSFPLLLSKIKSFNGLLV